MQGTVGGEKKHCAVRRTLNGSGMKNNGVKQPQYSGNRWSCRNSMKLTTEPQTIQQVQHMPVYKKENKQKHVPDMSKIIHQCRTEALRTVIRWFEIK